MEYRPRTGWRTAEVRMAATVPRRIASWKGGERRLRVPQAARTSSPPGDGREVAALPEDDDEAPPPPPPPPVPPIIDDGWTAAPLPPDPLRRRGRCGPPPDPVVVPSSPPTPPGPVQEAEEARPGPVDAEPPPPRLQEDGRGSSASSSSSSSASGQAPDPAPSPVVPSRKRRGGRGIEVLARRAAAQDYVSDRTQDGGTGRGGGIAGSQDTEEEMPPQHGQGEEEVAQIPYRPERSPVPGRKDCRGQQRHGHRVMDLVPEVDGGRAQQGETDPVPQGGQRMQPPPRPPPSPLPPAGLRGGSEGEGEGAAHAAHSFHFHWPVRQGWVGWSASGRVGESGAMPLGCNTYSICIPRTYSL